MAKKDLKKFRFTWILANTRDGRRYPKSDEFEAKNDINAKKYVKKITDRIEDIGHMVQNEKLEQVREISLS